MLPKINFIGPGDENRVVRRPLTSLHSGAWSPENEWDAGASSPWDRCCEQVVSVRRWKGFSGRRLVRVGSQIGRPDLLDRQPH